MDVLSHRCSQFLSNIRAIRSQASRKQGCAFLYMDQNSPSGPRTLVANPRSSWTSFPSAPTRAQESQIQGGTGFRRGRESSRITGVVDGNLGNRQARPGWHPRHSQAANGRNHMPIGSSPLENHVLSALLESILNLNPGECTRSLAGSSVFYAMLSCKGSW